MCKTQKFHLNLLVGIVSLAISSSTIAQLHSPAIESTPQIPPLVTAAAPILPQETVSKTEKSLYDRLGGVFAISAVVNHFSDALIENPIVGKTSKNPALRKWSTESLDRLPGLKFMRTLWVCNITGGPFKYTPTVPGKTNLGLEEAHRKLKISPAEFDEVAAELGRTLDFYKVPAREKGEVLAAFAAHKREVIGG